MLKLDSNDTPEGVVVPATQNSGHLLDAGDQATGDDVLGENPSAQRNTDHPSGTQINPEAVIARSSGAVNTGVTQLLLFFHEDGTVKKIVCGGQVFTPQVNDDRVVIKPIEEEFNLEPPPHDKLEDGIPSSQVIDLSELRRDNLGTVEKAGNKKRWR